MVLVHGNSSSSRVWQALIDGPFGARYRCLALDLPGHGDTPPPAAGPDAYSVPGFAAAVAGFVREEGLRDVVLVGLSLGGHAILEAADALGDAAVGFAVFGTPPVRDGSSFAEAYLADSPLGIGFQETITREEARTYAAGLLAPGSAVSLDPLVEDILATDPAVRAGIARSIAEGRFADEVALVASLDRPLAVLHGEEEQFVNRAYLDALTVPVLWRGAVQVVPGAGHAIQVDRPESLADLLDSFVRDLP
ncbi:Pimeloyl-ACP methyl ester carboxylesterase [Actinacidiphila guanduensis]|uniref:Pimeloyl-ACP methyl ester carboxylesterase n=1 Tax=Actinacidiphila guanduensis TaxID=310781 RepID=A0A1H0SD37_9ACTN|nr:Pimeloyl-ACP methyl ester carboxylesterase [Actinacidiphila guanduensis]